MSTISERARAPSNTSFRRRHVWRETDTCWILRRVRPSRGRQSLMKPRFRHGPAALDRGRGDPQRVGGLGNVEPGEESELDYTALAGVERGQQIERLVEGEHVLAGHLRCPPGTPRRG